MARSVRHEHVFRILSHTADFSAVLLGCGEVHCIEGKVVTQVSERVKVGPRKYRYATKQEFIDTLAPLEHLCCG